MQPLIEWYERLKDMLSVPLITLGSTQLTLWTLLSVVFLFIALVVFSRKLSRWIAGGLLARTRLDSGVRQSVGTIMRYTIVVVGLLIILQTAGIDLTALNILAGAVGIGVGFGLQNIANNFISGLIILFERPIKVGDRIEVNAIDGDVVRIGARSTSVVTNDNITYLVPNSQLIAETVINWSHNDQKVRFKIPVSVSYNSDVRLVERLLLETAAGNTDVLKQPGPAVRFMAFGDSGLQFELRAWTDTLTHQKGVLISSLNFGIYENFKKHGIEIPYPQRDLHIRSGALEIKTPPSTPST
jgi:small-conductance mechanosensitive channel